MPFPVEELAKEMKQYANENYQHFMSPLDAMEALTEHVLNWLACQGQ